MFCNACGAQLPDGSQHCQFCGAPQNIPQDVTQVLPDPWQAPPQPVPIPQQDPYAQPDPYAPTSKE